MDLFALLIFGAGCVFLGVALGKRRAKQQQMAIFPPDRRRAVHVIETRDDLHNTF
jgi:hypothetical protein